jgi:hypothetical protein
MSATQIMEVEILPYNASLRPDVWKTEIGTSGRDKKNIYVNMFITPSNASQAAAQLVEAMASMML